MNGGFSNEKELWRPIAGYEGLYEVSSSGRVRSYIIRGNHKDANGRSRLTDAPTLLIPSRSGGGLSVGLVKDGSYRSMDVARLVLRAFIGDCPPGMQVCHINGDDEDNELENLRWTLSVVGEKDKGEENVPLPLKMSETMQTPDPGLKIAQESNMLSSTAIKTNVEASKTCSVVISPSGLKVSLPSGITRGQVEEIQYFLRIGKPVVWIAERYQIKKEEVLLMTEEV